MKLTADHDWWAFLPTAKCLLPEGKELALPWSFHREIPIGKKSDQIDFFISYRRDGGATIARLVYEVLRLRGITGFIDTESLAQGDYSESISQHIEKANNFILIVSHNALDSEWVIKEVEAALKANKKIIPIFPSGVVCFPDNLDQKIAGITKFNAITLDHTNFEARYKTLMDWLITPHTKLMDSCLKHWRNSEDGLDEAFDAWKSISDNGAVLEAVQAELKKAWQGSRGEYSTNRVLKSIGTWDLKCIAQDLKIEHKGNRSSLLSTINDWLRGAANYLVEEDRGCDGDERYYRVASYLKGEFKSGERLAQLKGIVTREKLEPVNWRSSEALIDAVFDSNKNASLENIFTMLLLSPEEIKKMGAHFNLDSGSTARICAALVNWVDYTGRGRRMSDKSRVGLTPQ